jgi:hypothetical protein
MEMYICHDLYACVVNLFVKVNTQTENMNDPNN